MGREPERLGQVGIVELWRCRWKCQGARALPSPQGRCSCHCADPPGGDRAGKDGGPRREGEDRAGEDWVGDGMGD